MGTGCSCLQGLPVLFRDRKTENLFLLLSWGSPTGCSCLQGPSALFRTPPESETGAAIEHLEDITDSGELTDATFKGTPPVILAFKGGGTKGIVYVGALERLHEKGLYEQATKFAGTSAGAQQAAFCAFGFKPEDMRKIVKEAPWLNLLDRTPWYQFGCFPNMHRLIYKYGYCKGDKLQSYLEKVFEKQTGIKQCTFEQLHEWRKEKGDGKAIELKLGAIDITKQKFEYLDRHTHPNMPVSKACRASSSLPIIFTPVQEGDAIYIDGGLKANLPVKAFTGDLTKQTLAFNLVSAKEKKATGQFKKFTHFVSTVVNMVFDSAQAYHGVDPHEELSLDLEQERMVDVINICCGDHGVLETNINDARFKDLTDRGRKAVDRYICGHPGWDVEDWHSSTSFKIPSTESGARQPPATCSEMLWAKASTQVSSSQCRQLPTTE